MSASSASSGEGNREQFIRPLGALRAIAHQCEQLVRQESCGHEFHTLIAVDLDTVYMAAYPCESLALGSVFHAWPPLREVSNAMSVATANGNASDRSDLLKGIFQEQSLRIPLLTTIALSAFIFERRVREESFDCYALLPSHHNEWDRAVVHARDVAGSWANSLQKRVDVEAIRDIVNEAADKQCDIAEALVDRLPETASALFPAEISPDYALSCFVRWKLGGTIRTYAKIEGLPKYESLAPASHSDDAARAWRQRVVEDMKSSESCRGMTDKQFQNHLDSLSRQIDTDAATLALLDGVAKNPPHIDRRGLGRRPLRLILLTASARLWRVARLGGIADGCLRSPLAYLSDGRFFEWAFDGVRPQDDDASQLLTRLRKGLLGQWLEPLTKADDSEKGIGGLHHKFVGQWERLMSHLSTSLSLDAPSSSLRRALVTVLKERSSDPGAIAALLQHKIVETTQRLTQYASGVGLAGITGEIKTLRNLPPIEIGNHAEAQNLLKQLVGTDLSNPKERLRLFEAIMKLGRGEELSKADKVFASYLQSVLLSLVWFRLQQWEIASDVVGQAVSYALSEPAELKDVGDAQSSIEDLRGDEALYLAAVTGRLCAVEPSDLELPKALLEYAVTLCHDEKPGSAHRLRLESEHYSLIVAELLLDDRTGIQTPMAALAERKAQSALEEALDLLENETWDAIGCGAIQHGFSRVGQPDNAPSYVQGYALQQMYCSVGMLFLFVVRSRELEMALAERVHLVMERFHLASTSEANSGTQAIVDSSVARTVRELASWQLGRLGLRAAWIETDFEPVGYCQRLLDTYSPDVMAPFDHMRVKWLEEACLRKASSRGAV